MIYKTYEQILEEERINLEKQMYADEIKRDTIDKMMEADVNHNCYSCVEDYYEILKELEVL